jgi:DNA-binding MarR family transcriptional regulator
MTAMQVHANKKRRKAYRSATVVKEFDVEGVQRAMLAALEAVYESAPHMTLPQFLVALEVMAAERDGKPHTLVSLVNKLDMPFSTASRVVWSLTEGGGDLALVKYVPHPTDRRKKLLASASRGMSRSLVKVMRRAMIDYYGEAAKMLRAAS